MLPILVGVGVLLTCVWSLHRLDEEVIAAAAGLRTSVPMVTDIARFVSYVGDFLGFNLVLFIALRSAARILKSRRIARLAVASLLGACLAGATANVTRTLVGRPRPSTPVEDGLYGPSFSSAMHALPSAHAATAFGASMPILIAEPRLGVPLVALATSVGWSRIQLDRHHLTDVLVSWVIALTFSLPLSQWVLLARRQPFTAASSSESYALAPARESV